MGEWLDLWRKSEPSALSLLVRRQRPEAHEGPCRHLGRMTTLEDGFDDVRGQESERQDAADVAGVKAFPGGNGLDRRRHSVGELSHPALGPANNTSGINY